MKIPFPGLGPQHRALRGEALAALAATCDATRFCVGKDVEDFESNLASSPGYPPALSDDRVKAVVEAVNPFR